LVLSTTGWLFYKTISLRTCLLTWVHLLLLEHSIFLEVKKTRFLVLLEFSQDKIIRVFMNHINFLNQTTDIIVLCSEIFVKILKPFIFILDLLLQLCNLWPQFINCIAYFMKWVWKFMLLLANRTLRYRYIILL
jgi:hypothetical protein